MHLLEIYKITLLSMIKKGHAFRLTLEKCPGKNMAWQLLVVMEGYPLPGIYLGSKGQIRKWKSLDNAVNTISKYFPTIENIEINLKNQKNIVKRYRA